MAQLDLLGETLIADEVAAPMVPPISAKEKSPDALRTITEVAADLGEETHVLRFWETKFDALQPVKMKGNRRYYRPSDILLLRTIRTLLHERGYTIKGAQAVLAAHANPLEALNAPAMDDGVGVSTVIPAHEVVAALRDVDFKAEAKTQKSLQMALAELHEMRSILRNLH